MCRTDALQHRPAFLALPPLRHVAETVFLSLLLTLLFCAIYGTADYLTGLRSDRIYIHLPIELQIPFVPAMLLAYMSLYPMFWLGPFVLRTSVEVRALVCSLAGVTLMGGVGFLLLPAETAFHPPDVSPAWQGLYRIADRLNLDYNLAPSLHVAFSWCCADVYAQKTARRWIKFGLWGWALLIAASTVLTHQHHLLDVVLGLVVGAIGSRFLYARRVARRSRNSEI